MKAGSRCVQGPVIALSAVKCVQIAFESFNSFRFRTAPRSAEGSHKTNSDRTDPEVKVSGDQSRSVEEEASDQ